MIVDRKGNPETDPRINEDLMYDKDDLCGTTG